MTFLCIIALLIPVCCTLACAQGDPPAATAFYVAVNGADANPGTLDRPFASLARARQAVRELKAQGGCPAGGVTVNLRAGSYRIAETLDHTCAQDPKESIFC